MLEVIQGEEAPECQHGIQGGGTVALGQHEAVAVGGMRGVGVDAHDAEIQHGQQIHAAHRAAGMPGSGLVDTLKCQQPGTGCCGQCHLMILIHNILLFQRNYRQAVIRS